MTFDDFLPIALLACIGANLVHARGRGTRGRRGLSESLLPNLESGWTRAVSVALVVLIGLVSVMSTVGLLPHPWFSRIAGLSILVVQVLAIGKRHSLRRAPDVTPA